MSDARVRLVGRRLEWSCHVCGHPVSGLSTEAVQAAMDDHARFVNQTKDRATDEHFAEARLDALIAS